MRRAWLIVALAGAALFAVSVQTLCAADTVTPTFRRGATLGSVHTHTTHVWLTNS
jgi:hypothetical protein